MAKYIVSANGTEFALVDFEYIGADDFTGIAKAASMSINTLTLKSCPKCGEALSYTDPAEVGQAQGTITVQELLRWLDKKAAAARQAIKEGCDFSDRKCVHEPAIDYCRIASALIREFIQERAA